VAHRPSAQVRRDALLAAAVDVVVESGIAGATHRAVAARAGLPASTTSYFFPSIDALVEEALAGVVARVLARVQALRDLEPGSPGEVVEALVELAAAAPPRDVLVQFDAYLEAARRPALRPGVQTALRAFEDAAEQLLRRAGVPDPRVAARAFVALLDGFALHRTAWPRPDDDPAALARGVRALAAGFTQ
jgi:DNA-binding transcriptional regulator YbjK